MSEHDEQVALFNFLRTMESQHPELKWIHSIPNGGHRAMTTAKKMKAEGAKAGVLDIFVPASMGSYHAGLYVEMKYDKNTMTDNQHEFADFVTNRGYDVKVCYTWIEAAKEIFDYLGLELPEGVIDRDDRGGAEGEI